MNTAMKIRPRGFVGGPLVVIDVPLDRPMTATLVQDRSLNANHGTLINAPVFQYPGIQTEYARLDAIVGTLIKTVTLPFTMHVWGKTIFSKNHFLLELADVDDNWPAARLRIHPKVPKAEARASSNGDDGTLKGADSNTNLDDNIYRLITGVYRASDDRALYINAELIVRDTGLTAEVGAYTVSEFDTYSIGLDVGGSSHANDTGSAAGILVVNKAHSDAEIKGLYDRTKRYYGRGV